MKELLVSLYAYGDWVTGRLLHDAAGLPQEHLQQKLLPGFGSIYDTLVHLVGAEVVWCARWQGQSPARMLGPADLPDLESIRHRWEQLVTERRASFDALDEARLEQTLHWTNTRGQSYALPTWQVLMHCANHSTHHRSELAAMLSELGREPETTDLLAFYLDHAGQAWQPSRRA